MGRTQQEDELLELLSESVPMGARVISRSVSEASSLHGLSESTLNRILRKMDDDGLTHRVGAKGRVLTARGADAARNLSSEKRWNQRLGVLQLRTVEDVRELLIARRAVEREVVQICTTVATPADLAELERTLDPHEDSQEPDLDRPGTETIGFHQTLARMVPNKVLRALTSVIFAPRFDHLEQVLNLITNYRGTNFKSAMEHREILDAIRAGDGDAAERAMVAHINRLVSDASFDHSPGLHAAVITLLEALA